MAKKTYSFARLLMQIALGALLIIGGIWAFTGTGDFGTAAIRNVFGGTVETICVVIFGIIELLSGVFLILEIFLGDIFGKIDNVLMLIIIIVWIVAIVLADFIGGFLKPGFIPWLYQFASHLLVLGALWSIKD